MRAAPALQISFEPPAGIPGAGPDGVAPVYARAVDAAAARFEPGPEAELARRIAEAAPDRDAEAEAGLYRLLAPRVRRYGLRHLRDPHAAADLMQHVMALVLERLRGGELREPERVLSYVLGTCRLTVIDQRRGELRREDLLQRYADALPAPVVHLVPRLDHERVARCLEQLPERERSVIVLSFYDDQTADAVGAQMGLTAGNVRVIRHRGLHKLRQCVDAGRRLAA